MQTITRSLQEVTDITTDDVAKLAFRLEEDDYKILLRG